MDINRQNMNELFLGFQQIFKRGFEAADLEYRKFSTEVRSTTAVEVYPFLEQFGGMREWIGDRQLKNVSSQKKKVANRDFEDNVIVKKNDIEHLQTAGTAFIREIPIPVRVPCCYKNMGQ